MTSSGHVMPKPVSEVALSIPTGNETVDAFTKRVNAALKLPTTHLYIDTSFLMWMTRLGKASRTELRLWFDQDCMGRVHVPVWSAHEYLKHHIEETLIHDVEKQLCDIRKVIRNAYQYFRPLLDDPLNDRGEDNAKLRATTSGALEDLRRLVDAGEAWKKSVPSRSAEVIEFINATGARSTELYSQFPGLAQSGPARYAGRVPPGYQDRRKGKSGLDAEDANSVGPDGSNRFGDLLFWQEVLAHAKEKSAECVVIVSNDVKNDWRMGARHGAPDGHSVGVPELSPIPYAHPMLSLEASLTAGVGTVLLLDSVYLALVLKSDPKSRFKSFVDVAFVSGSPSSQEAQENRRAKVKEALSERRSRAVDEAQAAGFAFPDPPLVKTDPSPLARALQQSKRKPSDDEETLLTSMRSDAGSEVSILEVLSAKKLAEKDHQFLVFIARELHERANTETGYSEALFGLVASLDRFPPRTAAALYFGLLASMYLTREDNAVRLPPRSIASELIFDKQASSYALAAHVALGRKLEAGEPRLALYIPSSEVKEVRLEFATEPGTGELDTLKSMSVNGVELLTLGQNDDKYNLRAIFGSNRAHSGALKKKACELLTLPFDLTFVSESFVRDYALEPTLGFKRPDRVFMPGARTDD